MVLGDDTMAEITDMLEELEKRARKDKALRQCLLETRKASEPLLAFCAVCQEIGYEIYPMELVSAGEDFYAAMKRSTNGGGENSPMLEGEDDFYELFFANIEEQEKKESCSKEPLWTKEYLKEKNCQKSRDRLEKYDFSEKEKLFEFRKILPEETDQAIEIEKICFPANELCSDASMRERTAVTSDVFLTAVDRNTGKIAGCLSGLATDEYEFRDDFFENMKLHQPEGKNIMILGLSVLPQYRGQGLARDLMYRYLREALEQKRRFVILTCLDAKVHMYEKMGFYDRGISGSVWGGEKWHEMVCVLNV